MGDFLAWVADKVRWALLGASGVGSEGCSLKLARRDGNGKVQMADRVKISHAFAVVVAASGIAGGWV
jgi:hypothetical protein